MHRINSSDLRTKLEVVLNYTPEQIAIIDELRRETLASLNIPDTNPNLLKTPAGVSMQIDSHVSAGNLNGLIYVWVFEGEGNPVIRPFAIGLDAA
jgi:hypothetical protein